MCGKVNIRRHAIRAWGVITCAMLACACLCSCTSVASHPGAPQIDESIVDEMHSFSYSQLSASEKSVYRQILSGLQSNEASIPVDSNDADVVSKIYGYVLDDHPELFWYSGAGTLSTDAAGGNSLTPDRLMDEDAASEETATIDAVFEDWASTLPEGASEYDIAKSAYAYVIETTSYDQDAYERHASDSNAAGDSSTTIEGAFINHKAVCDGYASAFQYLMQREGIYCGLVTGTAAGEGKGSTQHAWNIVRIDGEYYYVDPTWGDPAYSDEDSGWNGDVNYDYLCITTDELFASHVPADGYTLPDCTSHACDYYMLAGRYYEEYDHAAVIAMLTTAYDAGEDGASFKLASDSAYGQAVSDLFDNSGIADLVSSSVTMVHDGTPFSYSYVVDPLLRTVRIRWQR